MVFQLVQVLIIRKKFREVFWFAESIQVNKYRVAINISRILNTKMIRIREHGHNLLLNLICLIGKINAVSKRFTHFCLTVNTWQTQARLVGRKYDLWLCKRLTIYCVKLVYDLFALLQHRKLILANRNCCCAESRDICCLADRIAEESNRNAGFEITHLDLRFHSRVTLNTGHCNQIHIIEGKLCKLRNHGLDENCGFLRINPASQIIKCYLDNILTNLLRVLCVISKRLGIRDHNINLVIISGILKLYTLR